MKRNLIIILFLTLTSFSVSYAVPIADPSNPHNMSSLSDPGTVRALPPASGGTDQICVFCHTPHSAAPKSPLWNRPDPDTMGAFPVYATTLGINKDAAAIALSGYDAANPEYPSGASRMCLSCHDGATSVGVLLGNQTIAMEGGLTNLLASIDLATSHPISFNYNNDVLAILTPGSYTLPDVALTPLDGAGQMQCTTCHDPHEDTRAETGVELLPFWRSTGTGGGLYDAVCNSCHIGTPGTPPHIP